MIELACLQRCKCKVRARGSEQGDQTTAHPPSHLPSCWHRFALVCTRQTPPTPHLRPIHSPPPLPPIRHPPPSANTPHSTLLIKGAIHTHAADMTSTSCSAVCKLPSAPRLIRAPRTRARVLDSSSCTLPWTPACAPYPSHRTTRSEPHETPEWGGKGTKCHDPCDSSLPRASS